MKFLSLVSLAMVAATTSAVDVGCYVNGVQTSIVDSVTGTCDFPIPDDLPVDFDYQSPTDYLVNAYYAFLGDEKYWNDVPNAGRIIPIPPSLFGSEPIDLFYVNLDASSGNSTESLRKRYSQLLNKRAVNSADDLLALALSTPGSIIQNAGSSVAFSVGPAVYNNSSSSSSSATGSITTTNTNTVIETSTTVIVVTSCSDDKCSSSSQTATLGPKTTTVSGTVTTYTTWCPIETTTECETKTYTITKCTLDDCKTTTLTSVAPKPSIYTITICESGVCTECPAVPSTTVSTLGTKTVTVTTLVPVVPTTVAPTSHTSTTTATPVHPTVVPTISTGAAAGIVVNSLLALVALPLAYLL